jgi:uncharacterized membrane protein YkvA (DUF1232 family)
MSGRMQARLETLKSHTLALYLAASDKRTPWPARIVILATVAYVLSPIDLIPDFIPVIGYLDDLVILPIGIWLALKLMPDELWQEYRERAVRDLQLPGSLGRRAAAVIITIWLIALILILRWIFQLTA